MILRVKQQQILMALVLHGGRFTWAEYLKIRREQMYNGFMPALDGLLAEGYVRSNGDKTYRVTPEGHKFIGE